MTLQKYRTTFLLHVCLLLKLSVPLAWGQNLVRLAASNEPADTNHEGETSVLITDVGSGVPGLPRPWICYTSDANNVLWELPNGTEVRVLNKHVAPPTGSDIFSWTGSGLGLSLHRGPNYLSPVGEHCCKRTGTTQRLCVTFILCPLLSVQNNGMVTYSLNEVTDVNTVVTYRCQTGYQLEGGSTRTCTSTGTSGEWTGSAPTCTIVSCGSPPSISNGSPGTPTRMTFEGTVTYSCDNGYVIQTSPSNTMITVSCLATGNWDIPTCTAVSCGSPPSISNGSPGTPTRASFGGTVAYICNNGYVRSGSATVTCQASGSWSTRPTCTAMCIDLPPLTNGMIVYSPTDSPRLEGAIATHSCVSGYQLSGGAVRECLSDTTWSGASIACEPVSCGSPPSISNGSPGTPTRMTFEGTVTYSCDNGYVIQTSPSNTMITVSCLATGNWDIPTCTAVSCGSPPSISNGSPGTPTRATFGGTVAYSCNNGYVRSGSATVTCQASGSWSTRPTCTAMCIDLPPLTNGMIVYSPTDSPRLEGATATHSCVSGYELSGGPVRECLSDTTWSGASIACEPVSCGSPPSISNGSPGIPTRTTFEGTVTYSCNNGYVLFGSATVTCQANESWSTQPTCTAMCTDLLLSNGMIVYSPTDSPRLEGAIATHSCVSGYQLSGGPVRECLSDTTWSGASIACEPVSCGSPPYISNGSPGTLARTTFEGTVTYNCNKGYVLSGSATVTCEANGSWSTLPTCTAMCTDLLLSNGMIVYSPTDSPRLEGAIATHSCVVSGYELSGGPVRECLFNTTWSGMDTTCEPVSCGSPPSISNGSPGTPTRTTFEGTVTYSCNNGYVRSGSATVTCQASGSWSTQSMCTAMCIDPPPLTNGMIVYSPTDSPRLEGAIATHSCVSGYELSGGAVRECLSDTTWSGASITCEPVSCGSPPSISNGSPGTPTRTTFEGTVTYSCNNGYVLFGSATVTCQANESWSTQPTCTAMCTDLLLSNGMIVYSPTDSPRLEGAIATHSCVVSGYELSGGPVRECLFNTTWSGMDTTCEPVSCGSPPSISNGSPGTPTRTTFEGTVTYSCNNGYVRSGSATVTCQASGSWSTQSMCTAMCIDPPPLTNGMIVYSPTDSPRLEGAIATHSCVSGYELSGGAVRECLSDTTWSGASITCEPVSCGSPPSISNGSPGTPTRTTFEGTVTYSCNNGYVRSGSATVTCQASGSWSTQSMCTAMCIDLPPLTNGMIVYSPTDSPRLEGAIATHSCVSGYELSGGAVRECLSDTTWSGASITCEPISCGSPPSISNGSPGTPTRTTFEGTVTYSCNNGYVLFGSPTVTCKANGSWSTLPTCTAMCIDLPPLTNGMIVYSPTDSPRLEGAIATHRCVSGYHLSCGSRRVCLSDTIWSGLNITCEPVDCGPLPDPTNGQVDTSSGTTFMNNATYSCVVGYVIDGTNTRTCGADGMWMFAVPTCVTLDRIATSNEPAEINFNGTILLLTDVGAGVGGSVLPLICYTSNTDNVLWELPNGTDVRVFNELPEPPTGSDILSWTDSTHGLSLHRGPNYLTPVGEYCCKRTGTTQRLCVTFILCPLLSVQNNGTVSYSPNEVTDVNTVVTYRCQTGYQLEGGSTRTCTSTGTSGEWTGSTPTCTRICIDLPHLDNGMITYSPTDSPRLEGAMATHSCVSGYELSGNVSVRVCETSGQWSGNVITCQPVSCGSPPSISNGSPGTPTRKTFEGTVTYSCNNGYILSGSPIVTCQANESWSTPPMCTAMCIDLPPLTNGMIVYSPTDSPRLEGAIATHSCVSGYELSGGPVRECLFNTTWSGMNTTCKPVDCGPLPDPTNGQVDTSSRTTFMNNATYSCDDMYLLIGFGFRICSFDGNWTNAAPMCIFIAAEVTASGPSMAGERLSLTCAVIGTDSLNPTIIYKWLQGKKVIGDSSTLTFDPLVLTDAGKYSCKVAVRSTLLSKDFSDSYDIKFETLNIQLRFRGIHDCLQYTLSDPVEKTDEITSDLAQGIEDYCKCDFDTTSISETFLQCFDDDSSQHVTYRGLLMGPDNVSTVELVSYIDQWTMATQRLVVQSVGLIVDTSCPIVITRYDSPECPEAIHVRPTIPPVTTSTNIPTEVLPAVTNASGAGAVVGGVIGALIVIGVVILVIAVLYLRGRMKDTLSSPQEIETPVALNELSRPAADSRRDHDYEGLQKFQDVEGDDLYEKVSQSHQTEEKTSSEETTPTSSETTPPSGD